MEYPIYSRNVGTVPNFTAAAGSYLVPNTETVTTNFVLQGDTGGGSWSTIPATEYELFPISGYVVQRLTDTSAGTGVDWSGYVGFRVHTSAKVVSGTYTQLTADQTITFAEDDTGYSPIGQVGELNGEVIKNAVTNLLVAGGGNVVADENGIRLNANGTSHINWISVENTYAGNVTGYSDLVSSPTVGQLILTANQLSGYTKGILGLNSTSSTGKGAGLAVIANASTDEFGIFNFSPTTNNGLMIKVGTGYDVPAALLHLKSSAPTLQMEDTTASAKSLLVKTDANSTIFMEATVATDILKLDLAAKNVILNSAAIATNATDGFLYIATCAGTPTGVPTAYTGRVAMVYDTTNNKFYIYNGAWKAVTLA